MDLQRLTDSVDGWTQESDMETPNNNESDHVIAGDLDLPAVRRPTVLCGYTLPGWLLPELKEVFDLTWSMFLISLFSFLMTPMVLMFCGHLGTTILGGVSLACTVVTMTDTVATGLAVACDTVFAQSFGSGNKRQMDIYLVKTMIIVLLYVLPCYGLMLNAKMMFYYMGQDIYVSDVAGRYLELFIPCLPGSFSYLVLMMYLRCQEITLPTILIGAIGCATNALAHYVFVFASGLGYEGSPLAMSFGFYSMTILLIWYIKRKRIFDGGFTLEALQEWGDFSRIALYGMLMMVLQAATFQVIIFVSGLYGERELGAVSILINIQILAYLIPFGIGTACNIRVGTLLGMGERLMVVRSIKISYGFMWVVYILLVCVLYPSRFQLPKLFSSNQEIVNLVGDLTPIFILFLFFDCHANLFCGVLQGCGRQKFTTIATIIGFYVAGLPLGICLMFKTKLGVYGLFWGMVTAGFVGGMLAAVAVLRTDWDEEIRRAQIRAGVQSEPENEGLLTKKKTRFWRFFNTCFQSCRWYGHHYQDSSRHWIRDRLLYVCGMLAFLVVGIVVRACEFIPGTPGYYANATLIHPLNTTLT